MKLILLVVEKQRDAVLSAQSAPRLFPSISGSGVKPKSLDHDVFLGSNVYSDAVETRREFEGRLARAEKTTTAVDALHGDVAKICSAVGQCMLGHVDAPPISIGTAPKQFIEDVGFDRAQPRQDQPEEFKEQRRVSRATSLWGQLNSASQRYLSDSLRCQ
ncbi:hypothetical protein EW145_g6778 [Phellinidium pouzarii]|uniref:Uncharacterized protein n=1 Tax=Phellinidium pouzarii TaxID=167371 RepID=A0A4S4KU98_9AGAM|nr:hypothetical protein EW145_g6778 [Phellinidium pouzarii]